jgi:flavin reductase (DIM6/NTAB) family NADH-FMN oxidoreductase RutF
MGEKSHVQLDLSSPIWEQFFTVSPLVVIGTKEGEKYDLAPKHMVTSLGMGNFFGFVCTPRHATYHNVKKEKTFTVSYPKDEQVVLASLAALPRCEEGGTGKTVISALPTEAATETDGIFLKNSYLFLECQLEKIVDGFDQFSLIAGRIIAAKVDREYLRYTDAEDEGAIIRQAPLLAYLHPTRFARIEESFAFPFPKGFKR